MALGGRRHWARAGRKTVLASAVLMGVTLAASVLWGCRGRGQGESQAPPPEPILRSRLDTAAPGEMAEGKQMAFDFPVPRELEIEANFSDMVSAVGEVSFEDLTNYVRQRVETTQIETGPAKTVFLNAALKAKPKRRLFIEVSRNGGRVALLIRDKTRKPAEQGLTEAERWRRAGLTPQGEMIDNQAE